MNKIVILFLLLILICFAANSQRFSLDMSPMIGRHFTNGTPADRTGRIGLSLAGCLRISSHFFVGTEILWTTRLRSPVSFYDMYDPLTGIRIVEPTYNLSSSKFIKTKYFFGSKGYPKMYAAISFGINRFIFKEGTAEGKRPLAKRDNFSFSPEFGAKVSRTLSVSMRYLHAGKTPAYNGLDYNQSALSLRSIAINPLLVGCTYHFSLLRPK